MIGQLFCASLRAAGLTIQPRNFRGRRGLTKKSRSAEIRAKLDHPIVDGDAHIVEVQPVFVEYLKQVAGPDITARYTRLMTTDGGPFGYYAFDSDAERRARGIIRPPHWVVPARNTVDRATAMLPGLLRERMDELGIDFAVVFTSLGLAFFELGADPELSQAACRALNIMYADLFSGHQDRLAISAVVPTFTPEAAIAELENSVLELGLKAAVIAGTVKRPLKVVEEAQPELAKYAFLVEGLGYDSSYDYDPFWRRCVDLGVAPCGHNNGYGWGSRQSSTSFCYNHVNSFAAAGEAFCRSLFFGGVATRFPGLKVGFMEGGVGWASSLYNSLVEIWGKRGPNSLSDLDPSSVDWDQLAGFFEKYLPHLSHDQISAIREGRDLILGAPQGARDPAATDEWQASGVRKQSDIAEPFRHNFYFGCEADDPSVAIAFNTKANKRGIKLNAMFGSDFGHWDVTDMTAVVAETYELVEEGVLDSEDYRAFMFSNAVEMHGGMNPSFFEGTAVEVEARNVLTSREASSRTLQDP
jgi:predicted TIM-barrel fold metal-dependent hydrolase